MALINSIKEFFKFILLALGIVGLMFVFSVIVLGGFLYTLYDWAFNKQEKDSFSESNQNL